MITLCWAAKGGSGTTVVAASIAITARRPTLLVDLAGDIPAALGLPEPDGPGVRDWLRSEAPASRIAALEIVAGGGLDVLASGTGGEVPPERWRPLATWLASDSRRVVVDAGDATQVPAELLRVASQSLLVTRACYLALRAAMRAPIRPTGVVLVEEAGRALGHADIEAGLGVPVVATVLVDPAVARAVDAGLLAARLPNGFRRVLEAAA
jgi:hypothetical protein